MGVVYDAPCSTRGASVRISLSFSASCALAMRSFSFFCSFAIARRSLSSALMFGASSLTMVLMY